MNAIEKKIKETLKNKVKKVRNVPITLPRREPKMRASLAPFTVTPPKPDAMVVEDAGAGSTEGVYLRNGDIEGKPRYSGLITGQEIAVDKNGFFAIWFEAYPSSGDQSYNSDAGDYANPSLVESWTIQGATGDLPAPTVRRATWADIDAAGIDRSTVPTL